ncbi:hypothetical protein HMPREF3201_02082 [Megasphaera sp. MJR8396C]|nr:hypothetical protein HMPREF3201_02082 [Megasphaera sp. MJR8396C]
MTSKRYCFASFFCIEANDSHFHPLYGSYSGKELCFSIKTVLSLYFTPYIPQRNGL